MGKNGVLKAHLESVPLVGKHTVLRGRGNAIATTKNSKTSQTDIGTGEFWYLNH